MVTEIAPLVYLVDRICPCQFRASCLSYDRTWEEMSVKWNLFRSLFLSSSINLFIAISREVRGLRLLRYTNTSGNAFVDIVGNCYLQFCRLIICISCYVIYISVAYFLYSVGFRLLRHKPRCMKRSCIPSDPAFFSKKLGISCVGYR